MGKVQVWLKSSIIPDDNSQKKAPRRQKSGLLTTCTQREEWEWKLGSMEKSGETLDITLEDKSFSVPASNLEHSVVLTNDFENDYPDDLIGLAHLNEPAVMTCLKERYRGDSPKIYTSTGPVLIALNPFCALEDVYSPEKMQSYWLSTEQGLDDPLDPHVFQIADDAFRSMMRGLESSLDSGLNVQVDQTILVSGESGAGKTVTTKYAMNYLAALSQRAGSDDTRAYMKAQNGESLRQLATSSIEARVLESNPILESFGNARTVRNDNSSRFGKFIELQFTRHGKLVGTRIDTYLLEKVRIVDQSLEERNYHIFYELLSQGTLSKEEKLALHIEKSCPEDFPILCSGTMGRRDGVTDTKTFRDLKKAMSIIGFSDKERLDVFQIAVSALHASKVTVAELDQECVLDRSNSSLGVTCNLLGITETALSNGLCYTSVTIGGQEIQRAQSVVAVEKSLMALIKAVYGALFGHLVDRINSNIAYSETEESLKDPYGQPVASIGVLDIFGFESFVQNSFEQLCINYCNEKLQQQFNTFLLQNEQAEYEKEGIEWDFIEFPDNSPALDLIENKKRGLLRILDDKCKVELPGNPDQSFVLNVYKQCHDMPRFEADRNQRGFFKFAIQHYAGTIEYSVDGFVEKNRDFLPKECLALLRTSTNPLVQQLVSNINHRLDSGNSKEQAKSSVSHTVGGQFRLQLADLRRKVDSTAPHYIRCIKPNDSLKPNDFEPGTVAEQLRCGGILEAIRVIRAGFTQHYPHQEFVQRYRTLGWKELSSSQADRKALKSMCDTEYKQECSILMEAIQNKLCKISEVDEGKVFLQMGKTKVFMRHHAFELLEQIRNHEQNQAAILINAVFRRYLSRIAYVQVREAFRSELASLGSDFSSWYAENRAVKPSTSTGSRFVSQRVKLFTEKLQLDKKNTTLNIHSIMHGLSSGGAGGPAWTLRDGIWSRTRAETNMFAEPETKAMALSPNNDIPTQ